MFISFQKAEFLKSLKTRVLDFQKLPTVCPSSEHVTASNITAPPPCSMPPASSNTSSNLQPVLRDSVYYIGKVTISKPHAPPKFIDDVIIQLKRLHRPAGKKRCDSGSSPDHGFPVTIKKVPSCEVMKGAQYCANFIVNFLFSDASATC